MICNANRDDLHKPKTQNQAVIDSITFNLYPNPNKGNFTIEYDLGKESGSMVIYNVIGLKIGEYLLNLPKGIMTFNDSKLSEGVYFYKVYTNGTIKKVGK